MATNKNGKPIVLNGVGSLVLKQVSDGKVEVIKCGTLQDLKLSFSASDDKVYGGDSPTPIYILSKDQSLTISATEATFSLEYLAVTNGAKMSNGGSLFFDVPATLIASGNTFTVPGNLTTIDPTSVIATVSDDADGVVNVKALSYTTKATPSTGQFNITTAGVMTFAGGDVAGKYISLSGVYTDEDSRKATITTASVPQFVEIRHVSNPVDMGDGKKVVIHTRIFRARATGKFEIDHKRQEAYAPNMEFEALYDTQRKDGRIAEISQKVLEA